MADQSAPNPPPREVLVEFLYELHETVSSYDRIIPVLRGSTLLQHWFRSAARPAADIDLEWFPQAGRENGFPSPLEHARRLCMCAVSNHEQSPIVFDGDIPVPSDGVNLSLWEYATPGVRCYTGWRWDDRHLSGFLQIDVAQAGSYDLAAVAVEAIELRRESGLPARVLAYTPEMLLAAKLSWIVRHVQRTTDKGNGIIAFHGEPKDLFDAHLLLTKGTIRPEVFQNAFLAVAMEDKLDWNQLEVLVDQGLALLEDGRFLSAKEQDANWSDFVRRHENLIHQSPAEMLREVVTRLRPLLGDLRQHLPFLRSIQADPIDEANLLIYADWLEERSDARAEFLRLFCRFHFHDDRAARAGAASSLPAQSGGCLYFVFGSPDRARDLCKRLEFADDAPRQQPEPSALATSSNPAASPPRPWWRFW
jgi:uncharacterized protein (TIGR02996 family)